MDTKGLGGRIKEARVAAKLSQADLAELLGVRAHTVYRYERSGDDAIEPRLEALVVIAQHCNVSIDWLATGEGDGPPAEPLEATGAVG